MELFLICLMEKTYNHVHKKYIKGISLRGDLFKGLISWARKSGERRLASSSCQKESKQREVASNSENYPEESYNL